MSFFQFFGGLESKTTPVASNIGPYSKLKDQLGDGQTMTFQLIIVVFELIN